MPYSLLGTLADKIYFSQEKRDEYVDQYFLEETNKFFLEAGTVDGVQLSNALFLERERNWAGLFIKPNNRFYERLAMVHRNAYCINTCSSLDNKISIANFRTTEMIGSVEEGYTETGKQRASSEFPNTSSVEVVCIPLGLFLTPLEMYHIHFFFVRRKGSRIQYT